MNNQKQTQSSEITIARNVQDACIQAAKEGFRDASMQGLCSEGAMEAAVSAIQMLDAAKIARETGQSNK
jgi:hypothetical protein